MRLRAKKGAAPLIEEVALKELVSRDYGSIVNAVALASGSFAFAEDAVQEAIVRAWTRPEQIDSPRAWVAIAALNLSRSSWRRALGERRARNRAGPIQEVPEPSPERVLVDRALRALPRRQREVAVLRYFLQLSTEETASALGVSVGTVKNSLSKARDSLAMTLGEDRYDEVIPE